MRAIRRHHYERRKAIRFHRHIEPTPRLKGIWANTPRCCTCFICGKGRKYSGPPMQEIRERLRCEDSELGE